MWNCHSPCVNLGPFIGGRAEFGSFPASLEVAADEFADQLRKRIDARIYEPGMMLTVAASAGKDRKEKLKITTNITSIIHSYNQDKITDRWHV